MRKILFATVFLFAHASVHAAFEGVLHMKMTAPYTSGTIKVYVSKTGLRQEFVSSVEGGMSFNMTMIMAYKNPQTVLVLNDRNRTYSEINPEKERQKMPARKPRHFTVKPIGELTVAGYRCKNVLLNDGEGFEMEVCTSRDIMNYADYAKLSAANPGNKPDESIMKALKDAKADGFWVRMAHKGKEGKGAMKLELVKAEKKSIPASMYEIPSGYKKEDGFMGAPGATMPPDIRLQMQEAMKNMTPEQRQTMEKMMKGKQ